MAVATAPAAVLASLGGGCYSSRCGGTRNVGLFPLGLAEPECPLVPECPCPPRPLASAGRCCSAWPAAPHPEVAEASIVRLFLPPASQVTAE